MLNLILGKSGYGKTEYVYNKMKELIENGEDNIFLLTPEQFSFVSERRLLEQFSESGIQKIENSNFTKLFFEVTKKYGGASKPLLDDGGRAVLMNKAVFAVQDKLKLFSKYSSSTSFVDSMIRIFDELNVCDITPEILLEISDSNKNKVLSDKIYDIYLIILAYKSLIKSDYFDPSDKMKILFEKLVDSDYFKGRTVIIDGFSGFVALEQKIIEIIFRDAKDVYVAICADGINDSENGYGLFSHTKKSANTLLSIAGKVSSTKNIIKLEKDFRHSSDDLATAEKYLYSHTDEKFDCSGNIELFEAQSISNECDYVSRNIIELLRSGKYRARDIAVVTRDLNTYQSQMISSFKKYGVPFFDDERQSIKAQPLIVFVQFLFRVICRSFRSEDVFSLIKTGLFGVSLNDVSELENYCILWNINGKKWFSDFEDSPKGFSSKITDNDKKYLERINKTRKLVIKPLLDFRDIIKDADAKKICESIYHLLTSIKADKNLKNIAQNLKNNGFEYLAEEQTKVWDILMKVLNQMALTIGEDVIKLDEFERLFSSCISAEDVGIIPQGLDNVQFGEADRIRLNNPKVTFIVGASENDFPKAQISGGVLTENDRKNIKDKLTENDKELYSSGQTLIVQEKYFAYMAVSSPSEKLFVSYSSNVLGEEKMPSYLIRRLSNLFADLSIKTIDDFSDIELVECNENAFEIMALNWNDNTEFESSLKSYFAENEKYKSIVNSIYIANTDKNIEINDKELSKNLFGNDMYLSASRIENYFSCPFQYFCKFGVAAMPRKVAELDSMQTGTLIHYVLENIIKEVGSKKLSEISPNERHSYVTKYFNEYFDNELGGKNAISNRFSYQFTRISKMLFNVVDRLALEFSQSKFVSKAFEMSVNDDGEVDSPVVELGDGGSIKIRGSIDRVDLFEKDNEKYVRVVDYKSGAKEFNLNDILYGINLQMFIYLFALCNDKDNDLSGVPSGVLYMHSSNGVASSDNRRDKESTVAKKSDDEYKMKGIVLDESSVIEAMENDIEGKFIPVSLKKGEIVGDIVSIEEMGRISRKINSKIAEMGLNLHNGKINPYPINGKNHDKTCEFCDYSSVCMNKNQIEMHQMDKLKNDEVKELLKEDE